MLGFAKKLFGSSNDRSVKAMMARVQTINALEPSYAALSDGDLRAKTDEFKAALAAGKTLDDILPQAFAAVREAAKRTLGQRHYDVQLVGGMVLHRGGIAEMRTGEGKTLVATAPVYLNALAGKGVHVITVNDYLATRDSEWMGQIYRFLGLQVGVIVNGLSQGERQRAYGSDITYGTNNEFGFDYLRDNLVYDAREMVQRVDRLDPTHHRLDGAVVGRAENLFGEAEHEGSRCRLVMGASRTVQMGREPVRKTARLACARDLSTGLGPVNAMAFPFKALPPKTRA